MREGKRDRRIEIRKMYKRGKKRKNGSRREGEKKRLEYERRKRMSKEGGKKNTKYNGKQK